MKMRKVMWWSLLLVAGLAWAGEADVIAAKVSRVGGAYNFDVTTRSKDKGWDNYCDRFEVLAPDGKVLGVRKLLHPHENEQPFTRELQIPTGIDHVLIRARHKPRGYDGAVFKLKLPK
jgi:hypothetical protein